MMVRNLGPLSQRDPRGANFCFTSLSARPVLTALPTAEEHRVPVKLKALPVWGITLVWEVTVQEQIFKALFEGVKISNMWLPWLP